MIKNVFFDLDGTLTDPSEGLTNSLVFALKRHGVEVPDKSFLKRFIGPPLFETFEGYFGFSHEEAAVCVEDFREYFRPTGIFENSVFPGITDVLSKLRESGRKMIVATSKPELFAHQILEHFEIEHYFDYVAGGTMDESLIAKPDILRYALEATGITDLDASVMIGDRHHDIFGGRSVGMHTIGVLYGFGDREELEEAGADAIAEKVDDLFDVIEAL